jgi:hypothetical protein
VCVSSATALVVVNGIPIEEFKLCRGLRQEDPLSPFLFLLATKGVECHVELFCGGRYLFGL